MVPIDINNPAHFYLKSNSNFEKKFGIWGRFPFADFSFDRRPINSLVNISVIKENMHCNVSPVVMHLCCQCEFTKAGRLVGKAECFAVIALADNATFLLAVNRIAAPR